MKLAFSTLGCPEWELVDVVAAASGGGYDGVELRALAGSLDLLSRPEFAAPQLPVTCAYLKDAGVEICCVDTSCTFHSPDASERANQVGIALAHAELASRLDAPLIRVFPDTIQPGAQREETRDWIADSLHALAERMPDDVDVALETHGDFARAEAAAEIVTLANHAKVKLIWDVANSVAAGDTIEQAGRVVKPYLAHIHLRDAKPVAGSKHWLPVLAGHGRVSFAETLAAIRELNYNGYVCFEWEKYWRPEIEEPEVALPDFVNAIRNLVGIKVTRPNVLVLASDVLFQHFFTEKSLGKLGAVTSWTRSALRQDSPELRSEIADADVLMTTWHSPFLTREMLGQQPRVKLIAHCGGEVKSRVAPEIFEFVTITNAADPMARGVAEMALALTLTLVRRIPEYATEMRKGVIRTNEQVSEGETLFGRRVGIVGFGRIGRTLAKLLMPFGVDILVSDPYVQRSEVTIYDATLVQLDELVSSCSVVVLCAALTPETHGMFDRRRLSLLRDGSYLINVARGGLIDMEAMLQELRKGRITVALDVTDPWEPLPADHELRKWPNVTLTPHIAAGGIEMRREIGAMAVEEVVRFASGLPPLNRVTTEMLATMT